MAPSGLFTEESKGRGKFFGLINLTPSVHCQVEAFFRRLQKERQRQREGVREGEREKVREGETETE